MNKSMKPSRPAARQQGAMTPEEEKEQIMRAIMQKKASLAEGILFNLMQNPNLEKILNGTSAARLADGVATDFMEVVYRQKLTVREEDKED